MKKAQYLKDMGISLWKAQTSGKSVALGKRLSVKAEEVSSQEVLAMII